MGRRVETRGGRLIGGRVARGLDVGEIERDPDSRAGDRRPDGLCRGGVGEDGVVRGA